MIGVDEIEATTSSTELDGISELGVIVVVVVGVIVVVVALSMLLIELTTTGVARLLVDADKDNDSTVNEAITDDTDVEFFGWW